MFNRQSTNPKLALQAAGYLIFLVSHLIRLELRMQPIREDLIWKFRAFVFVLMAIALWDYYANFKVSNRFKFSSSTLVVLTIFLWISNEMYLMAFCCFALAIGYFVIERKLYHEDEPEDA